MRRVVGVRTLLVVAALVSGGCSQFVHPNPTPVADREEWPRTLATAQERAGRGEFDAADSLLGQFSRQHPGSHGAGEAVFWQAMYRLDPSNRNGSLPVGLAALDAYLANPSPHDHGAEALTLRRVAAQLDAANHLAASASMALREQNPPNRPTTENRPDQRPADTSSDAEIKRLKDELAKANAELERIKRRLAQPPGKG
ncbi:MAG TPA: hypothetical protein VI259_28280 [Gemmatimonadaceae bacterium]